MQVISVKTHKITSKDLDLLKIVDRYIKKLGEGSIVVVASKIVAITQGRIVNMTPEETDREIIKEAQKYIPKEEHKYKLFVTINQNHLTYSSGIDESNGNGFQVLWPLEPQNVANALRAHLQKKHKIKKVGVIMTDMAAIPLRWGIIAGEIAYSGFNPLRDLIGKPDVFGNEFKYTREGVLNGLAAAAGVVMGEGAQQTPLGIITDIPFVEFVDRNPLDEELKDLIIDPENDIFGPLFTHAKWKKGGSK